MRVLLDEMYPAALADHLQQRGIETTTVAELNLDGTGDPGVLAAAARAGCALLTENVGDFMRLASGWASEGRHHCGVMIALSSRFSRRASGLPALADAVAALRTETLDDRVIFLQAQT